MRQYVQDYLYLEMTNLSITFCTSLIIEPGLEARQGNVRQTLEQNGRNGQEVVAFCPIAHKLAYSSY